MKRPYICAVIGKNFGDEGKGLAVDYLSLNSNRTLVIRHNGGAQSGHTVDLSEKRFVFHELSSGSFRGTDTLWADTYYPDLYKLGEEVEAFREVSGFVPSLYAQPEAQITIIDDVILNMAAEEARGEARHGSCGMGIYEAQCRGNAGFAVTLEDIWNMDEVSLVKRLQDIRREYLPKRLQELGLSPKSLGDYAELLENQDVLRNVSSEIYKNLVYVQPAKDIPMLLHQYDRVIFENGQGLLLDEANEKYAPHVTASRTGLHNPCAFLKQYGFTLDEVVYVTRSYVTRHGAGELPFMCRAEDMGVQKPDVTNVENKWQGRLRYARHGNMETFTEAVESDLRLCEKYHMPMPCRVLMVTHLNETDNYIRMEAGDCNIYNFCEKIKDMQKFDKFYLSNSPFAQQISTL